MKSLRFKAMMRGVRLALDPSTALRRRSVALYAELLSEDEAICRDWYVVGDDMRDAAKKFREDMISQVLSDA
ncbi:MAG TPA: hypothetical protein VH165_29310 [Kofleriaceae bacterium]|nr:hypothetical protein [Kofleriaceae bacterium]